MITPDLIVRLRSKGPNFSIHENPRDSFYVSSSDHNSQYIALSYEDLNWEESDEELTLIANTLLNNMRSDL